MLVAFNLIPAFPMDGGRILRAGLGMKLDHTRATIVAARVGQGIAVVFFVMGFFGNFFLMFIAIFVFSGAQQELSYAQRRSATAGLRVGDAMLSRFQSFPGSLPVAEAAAEVAGEAQPIYPVTDDRLRVTGMVLRSEILNSARAGTTLSSLASVVPTVSATAEFGEAYSLMQSSGSPVLPVVNPGGQIVGLISMNLLSKRSRG
jgi:CBS domain-containing protein